MMDELQEFIKIWNNYFHINPNPLDKYETIMNKIKNGNELEFNEKIMFMELIEIMVNNINHCSGKYKEIVGLF